MSGSLSFTILGCGSSGGVPRIGGHWGACDPAEPRNARTRCSMLISRAGPDGTTRVLIDTTPDLRTQLLRAGVGAVDAVLYTHSHADHVHGIDDLRQIVFNTRKRLPVWADGPTQEALLSRFGYAFVQPEGSPYPPILEMHTIDGPVSIEGPGGPISLMPLRLSHGTIDALGFRIGGLAYLPDLDDIYPESLPLLDGLDILVIDALRRTPHPTHLSLEGALGWIARLKPAHAVLTNMHLDLDYATVAAETPDHVTPAHDGLTLHLPG